MKSLVIESLISEMKVVDKDKNSPALCIMEGPCMEFDKVNRNNRIYSKKLVEDRIINNPVIKEALKNKSMLGEGGHPETRVEISYPDVALCVEKLWIPKDSKNLLWGRFAILDTPVGRILETLVKYGSSIGISARAMTDSVERDGHEVISETTYDLITFDAVPDPGFKCARLSKVESAMRPIDSMTLSDLQSASSSLKSAKVPAFESRIRMIDKEIERRKSIDVSSDISLIKESISQIKKAYSVSKVKDIEELVSFTKKTINEAKQTIEAYNRTTEEYNIEIDRLTKENNALIKEIQRLDDLMYTNSLSTDYKMQMCHLEHLITRMDRLEKEIKSSNYTDSKIKAKLESNKNKKIATENYSRKFGIKENRINKLLSNTHERVCESYSQKIAQFERDPNEILDPCETIEEEQDSLTRTVRAQVRR